ncbi:EF-Hand_1 [Hexamita inflata]|uniref:Calcium-binding site n=1 Tax=Hexamita inflata TaxID=28002 RepID=A0AA86QJV7_9EUKA|nr:EF-Hand 1 [Hexamita inflata]
MTALENIKHRICSIMRQCCGVLQKQQECVNDTNGNKEVTVNDMYLILKEQFPEYNARKHKQLLYKALKQLGYRMVKEGQQYHISHVYLKKDLTKILDEIREDIRLYQAELILKNHDESQKIRKQALKECDAIFKTNEDRIVFEKEGVIHQFEYQTANQPQQQPQPQRQPQQQQQTDQQEMLLIFQQDIQRLKEEREAMQNQNQAMQQQMGQMQQQMEEMQQHEIPQQYEGQHLAANNNGQVFFKPAPLNPPNQVMFV